MKPINSTVGLTLLCSRVQVVRVVVLWLVRGDIFMMAHCAWSGPGYNVLFAFLLIFYLIMCIVSFATADYYFKICKFEREAQVIECLFVLACGSNTEVNEYSTEEKMGGGSNV